MTSTSTTEPTAKSEVHKDPTFQYFLLYVEGLEPELLLDLVSERIFETFSPWSLLLQKTKLDRRKDLSSPSSVLSYIFDELERILVETKALVDEVLDQTDENGNIEVPERTSRALDLPLGARFDEKSEIPKAYKDLFDFPSKQPDDQIDEVKIKPELLSDGNDEENDESNFPDFDPEAFDNWSQSNSNGNNLDYGHIPPEDDDDYNDADYHDDEDEDEDEEIEDDEDEVEDEVGEGEDEEERRSRKNKRSNNKKCPYCKRFFERIVNYKGHLESCRKFQAMALGADNKTCPKCKKEFASTKYLVYRHLKVCTGEVKDDPIDFNTFKCSTCSKEYRTFSHYIHHITFCGTAIEGQREMFFWKGKNVCGKCGKVFNSVQEKRESNHFCNPEKHFKCPKCDYRSYYPRHLKDHYEVKHGQKRDYCCDTCGKTFAYRTAFRSHMKIHGERMHSCQDCGKKFHNKTNLDLHRTIHQSKEMPCEICGKIFPNATYLNRHKNTQHPADGVFRKFPCPYCPGAFREKKYTKKHVRMKHPGMPTNF